MTPYNYHKGGMRVQGKEREVERAIHRMGIVFVVKCLDFSLFLRVIFHAFGGHDFLVAEAEDDTTRHSSARALARLFQLDP